MNHISYIVRKSQVDWTDTTKPGDGVPGGGVATKTWNVKQAVPGIQITDNFESDRPIVIVDPLAFSNNIDLHLPTIRDSKAFKKVLWIEEQAPLRWPGALITQVADTFDIICVSNEYLKQQLQPFMPNREIRILYTPIPVPPKTPDDRGNSVLGMGQISLRKNTHGLVRLFDMLPDTFTSTYIGNSALWGKTLLDADKDIESDIAATVGTWIPSATLREASVIQSQSKFYVNMSIYDVGCLSFLECAMAGCICLAWDYHPQFDEYKRVIRFKTASEAVAKLEDLKDEKLASTISKLIQKEVAAKHSYASFRKQIRDLSDFALFGD